MPKANEMPAAGKRSRATRKATGSPFSDHEVREKSESSPCFDPMVTTQLVPHANMHAAASFLAVAQQEAPWLTAFLWQLVEHDRTGLFNGPQIPLKYKDHVTKRGSPLHSWNGTIILDIRARDLKTLGNYSCGICGLGWRRAIISHVNDHINSRMHQDALIRVSAALNREEDVDHVQQPAPENIDVGNTYFHLGQPMLVKPQC